MVPRASLVAQQLRICLQCRRLRLNPWVRMILWRRKWQPTPAVLLGKSHEQRSLSGYSPRDCKSVGHDWATKQQHGFKASRPNLHSKAMVVLSHVGLCPHLRRSDWRNWRVNTESLKAFLRDDVQSEEGFAVRSARLGVHQPHLSIVRYLGWGSSRRTVGILNTCSHCSWVEGTVWAWAPTPAHCTWIR